MKKIFLILSLLYSFSFAGTTVSTNPFCGYDNAGRTVVENYRFTENTFVPNSDLEDFVADETWHFSYPLHGYINNRSVGYNFYWHKKTSATEVSGTSGYNAMTTYVVSKVISGTCETYLAENPPTCTDREKLNTDTNTCEEVCPLNMTRKTIEGTFFDEDVCFPDQNVTKDDCLANDGYIWAQLGEDLETPESILAMTYGKGCYQTAYLADRAYHANLSFAVSGLLPDIPSSYLARFGKTLFSGGKSVWDWVSSFFKSDETVSSPSLLTYEPEIIDVEISPTTGYSTPTFNYRTILDDLKIESDGTPTPSTLIVSDDVAVTDNLYVNEDMSVFESNSLVSKSLLDNKTDISLPDVAVNETATQTLTVDSNLLKTKTVNLPASITKIDEVSLADRVVQDYNVVIKNADESQTNVFVKKETATDGTSVETYTVETPIKTDSGTKTMKKSYSVTKDAQGTVTNTIYNTNSSITSNTSVGGTTTTTNNISTSTATISSTSPAVDLTPVTERLDKIKDLMQDMIDYKPDDYAKAESTLSDFTVALDAFDVHFNDYLDFVTGIQDNLNDLISDFEDAKSLLEDKPVVSEITGTCAFEANWIHGTTVTVDPCLFVSPYRPLLALFFTLMGTISVVGFAVRHLVSKGV